jgi:hypothetical protein
MEKNETTPDELLDSFKGRSLKSIIVFTVVVHAVILVGTSLPSLLAGVIAEDTSGLTEGERLAAATEKAKAVLEGLDEERNREANAALVEIAETYGLKAQDLGDRVQSKTPDESKMIQSPESTSSTGTTIPEDGSGPRSAIEEEIEKVEAGPDVPPVEDEEEDLFK